MSIITPERFRQVEVTCTEWLQQAGFEVGDLTYHRCLPESLVNVLRHRRSPTAQVVRTRADRLAVHKVLPLEFLVEVKSPGPWHYANALFELLPLAGHIADAEAFGTRCLYAYLDTTNRIQPGFWCHQRPCIRWIRIPDSGNDIESDWFAAIAYRYFPEARVETNGARGRGSNDPFVIMDEKVLRTLADWRALVEAAVEAVEKGRGSGHQ